MLVIAIGPRGVGLIVSRLEAPAASGRGLRTGGFGMGKRHTGETDGQAERQGDHDRSEHGSCTLRVRRACRRGEYQA